MATSILLNTLKEYINIHPFQKSSTSMSSHSTNIPSTQTTFQPSIAKYTVSPHFTDNVWFLFNFIIDE